MDTVMAIAPGVIAFALIYVGFQIFLKIIERDAQNYIGREYPWYGKTVNDWVDAYKAKRK